MGVGRWHPLHEASRDSHVPGKVRDAARRLDGRPLAARDPVVYAGVTHDCAHHPPPAFTKGYFVSSSAMTSSNISCFQS
jgi:hypothetical protein